MSNSRDLILGRVRDALAPLKQRAPLPEWDHELVVMRNARGEVDAWGLFSQRLKAVNGTPLTSIAELVSFLEAGGWTKGYCDPVLWPLLREAFPASFTVETELDRSRIDDYAFGITAASGAVAETGSVVLTDTQTSRRLGALAPWVHIVLLRRSQIHIDIPAALAALPKDPNVIWVTGPSKTADVEGILIEGVHGPGRQVALLVGD
jgi:L-lactate dehydrogenase complex protein LldG